MGKYQNQMVSVPVTTFKWSLEKIIKTLKMIAWYLPLQPCTSQCSFVQCSSMVVLINDSEFFAYFLLVCSEHTSFPKIKFSGLFLMNSPCGKSFLEQIRVSTEFFHISPRTPSSYDTCQLPKLLDDDIDEISGET